MRGRLIAVPVVAAAPPRPRLAAALGATLDELSRRGVRTDAAALVAPVVDRLPRLSAAATADQMTALARELERGYEQYVGGEIDAATETLAAARAKLLRRPWVMAGHVRLRQAFYRGLVLLALSADRRGHADLAAERMAELVRSFPERPLDGRGFGPQALALYEKGVAAAAAVGRSHLVVEAGARDSIFVDERFVGRGRADVQLYAGEVRVLVRGEQSARHLRVACKAKGAVHLEVTSSDAHWVQAGGWSGLVAPASGPHVHAAASMSRVLGASGVVTVDTRDGRIELVRHDRSGAVAARASARLPVDAHALVDAVLAPPASGDDDGFPVGPTVLIGVGLATAGVGTALLFLDGKENCADDTRTCPTLYHTATPGWIAAGVGAGVLAGGLVWLLVPDSHDDSREPNVVVRMGPAGTAAAIVGHF